MSVNCNVGSKARKPKKPSKNFPLGIHKGSGQWCKKVRGKVHYFGKVADDPKGVTAREEWLAVKDDLLAGREPRARTDGLTVVDLCNRFYEAKTAYCDTGELSSRTLLAYHRTCAAMVKSLGRLRVVADLEPDDFRKLRATLSENLSVVTLRNEIIRVRSVFKFGSDERLMDRPILFGQAFALPKLDAVRRARQSYKAANGDKMFEADEIRLLLSKAEPALKAMILLGANCGFGNTDCSSLPMRAVDLDAGWVNFPRPKTGVDRRCPLWPETVEAIREWLPQRPKPRDKADAGLMFLTCRGCKWVWASKSGAPTDRIVQMFNKVLRELGLKRPGVCFYALRHGFETTAGDTGDQIAVDSIMGHIPPGMGGAYRERIEDARLIKVVNHVRSWLFDKPETS